MKKCSTLLLSMMSYITSSPSCTIPGRIGWTETLGAYCTSNVTFAAFLFLDEWNPKESSTAGKSSASFEASHLRIKYQLFCYSYQNGGFTARLIAVVHINHLPKYFLVMIPGWCNNNGRASFKQLSISHSLSIIATGVINKIVFIVVPIKLKHWFQTDIIFVINQKLYIITNTFRVKWSKVPLQRVCLL